MSQLGEGGQKDGEGSNASVAIPGRFKCNGSAMGGSGMERGVLNGYGKGKGKDEGKGNGKGKRGTMGAGNDKGAERGKANVKGKGEFLTRSEGKGTDILAWGISVLKGAGKGKDKGKDKDKGEGKDKGKGKDEGKGKAGDHDSDEGNNNPFDSALALLLEYLQEPSTEPPSPPTSEGSTMEPSDGQRRTSEGSPPPTSEGSSEGSAVDL